MIAIIVCVIVIFNTINTNYGLFEYKFNIIASPTNHQQFFMLNVDASVNN
ncbi:hypothetical protein [Methanobrevibacter sp.]|nr:hypothetical protein [Methanobrevibacter sp.]MBQ2831804.1 hypothetical protein [Methanobrevibacter sp.]